MVGGKFLVVFLVVILIVGGLALSGSLFAIGSCGKEKINVACSQQSNCRDFYKNEGAPQTWLDQQRFTCEQSQCFIQPTSCGSEFVRIE